MTKKFAIYFLIRGGAVVYVGQSYRVDTRISIHKRTKKFDSVRIIQCPADRLNYYENRWILRFKPQYNRSRWFGIDRPKKKSTTNLITLNFDDHILSRLDEMAKKSNRRRKNFIENMIISYVLNQELKEDWPQFFISK